MFFKTLRLNYSSCQQIWIIEKEKDRENETVGDRPAKLHEKKSDRELEREKKTKETLSEERHESFVTAVRKWEMPATTKMKMSGSKKKSEQEHVRLFVHKMFNLEVSGSFTL